MEVHLSEYLLFCRDCPLSVSKYFFIVFDTDSNVANRKERVHERKTQEKYMEKHSECTECSVVTERQHRIVLSAGVASSEMFNC